MPKPTVSRAAARPKPELSHLSEDDRRRYQRVRGLSSWLDNAISLPGTGLRFGIDPILGLLPVGGDAVSFLLSIVLVIESARLGLPKEKLAKMVGNLVFDELVGTVPVAGDLVDVAWKANVANLQLLEDHLQVRDRPPVQVPWGFLVLLLGGLLGVVVVLAALGIWLATWLWQTLFS